MKNVYSSPSSIVFLVLATSLCIFTYVGKVSEANFMLLSGLAFQHYFRRSSEKKLVDNSVDNSNQG